MAYTTAEARTQLLDAVAEATDELGVAVAALGEAYEQLDERNADRLEEELFRPVQTAYGRAQRLHAAFAERSGLPTRTFTATTSLHLPSSGVRGLLDAALAGVARAEGGLTTLQDSMLPVDVGDPELRAALADVRTLIAAVPSRAREFTRTLGR